MFANRGVRILNIISTTLKTISRQNVEEKETDSLRIAMPEATKTMTSKRNKNQEQKISAQDCPYLILELTHILGRTTV
jgi:hypothetical protein